MKNKAPAMPKQQAANDQTPTKRSTRGIAQKVPKAKKKSGPRAREAQIPPERVSSRRRAVR
ncbi:hypothetical protein BDU57DRAFT_508728 [Ampelomyces quisqualis]|uniref:Uncharacterized protein n=1 Tax=Ampelomyces quisqualis TaxID=50730 RepID=A0A6A5R0F0_AMPQU|nr:hypothetical protein BDU57DRAFT_508728 [Ampelomyces quisqualis]